jgi:hypothetical protein
MASIDDEHWTLLYFGFDNDLDVSFGVIMLRLCYHLKSAVSNYFYFLLVTYKLALD